MILLFDQKGSFLRRQNVRLGRFFCKSIIKASLRQADPVTDKTCFLHLGERSKEFDKKSQFITEQGSQGNFQLSQTGHFELGLGDWEIR